MKRGDLYRVHKPHSRDPKRFRVFVVVGRQAVIDSEFSTVTCAPVYSNCEDLDSQVAVGVDEGLKHDSCIFCDELVSFPKTMLTDSIGSLSPSKIRDLAKALRVALALED